MNERRFSGDVESLRAPERVAAMEVERTTDQCLDGITVASALDVGTGSGIFAEAFATRGCTVAGVDLREEMLEAARTYVPSGDFRMAHMESLPFRAASFDLVFLGHVLHEADDVANALREAARVARQRVAVFEWPYTQQQAGPPLDHRLKPEMVAAVAETIGFTRVETIKLDVMVLYRLDL